MHLYTINNYNMFCNTFNFKACKPESLAKFKNILLYFEGNDFYKDITFRELILIIKKALEV